MEMTEDQPKILQEHEEAHKLALQTLKETDAVLEDAQSTITVAREKLKRASEKYQERLHGPKTIRTT